MSSLIRRACGCWSRTGGRREFAKIVKKKKKDDTKIKDPYKGLPAGWDALNYLKDGQPPEEKPDEEYPEWLWTLTERRPMAGELRRRALSAFEDGGAEEVVARLTDEERTRLWRLARKSLIKQNNDILRRKWFRMQPKY
uniref:Large ribosomal subunit protein mL54 n=1 Tax=Rhodosorus marinus TaxID=101924 RepID=A0A7S0BVH3_9RHOD|mmetsp:Transcript_9575/g.13961  ORF Transcript_9575/g.13961 Transcript_9575/m.13961 type:complete len:139 (+) Transcript_9575:264-680(+)|eukprot:CAMPEP_0184753426 /NCGR_PEP_ID=MMETSP0315-20130426/44095_1 /TAXON_ID=101924 /ORGANISM="Rhodosorus marinus, Strain UTEX LB 2760" /LENGTH=138 /DNA_ID=CAMNT_0027232801 /DNA_START=203 /DNA_END=619 /DNA_ORIENTATION=-